MPVIMMSGHATIDTAVEATRIGALNFLEKPIALQKLLKAVEQGLARQSLLQKTAAPSPLKPTLSSSQDVPPTLNDLRSHPEVVTTLSPALVEPEPVAPQFSFDMPLREARDMFERAYFEYHLQREGGSMTRVAEKTGLERTHLYRKLKQLGVDLGRSRQESQNN